MLKTLSQVVYSFMYFSFILLFLESVASLKFKFNSTMCTDLILWCKYNNTFLYF